MWGAISNADAAYVSQNIEKIFKAKSMPNAKGNNFWAVTVRELK